MPKINVYLSDELADAVKRAGLPVSPICQQALEAAVQRVTSIRATAKLDLTLADPTAQLTSFTAKARTAVNLAIEAARGVGGAARVGTEHLLAGILAEQTNLALNVLRSLDIEPEQLREELAAGLVGDGEPVGRLQLDAPAAAALEAALTESLGLGHNYIGCEHLLLGLIAEPDGAAGELLRSHGAEPRLARRAVAAAMSGFAYARSQAPGPDQAGQAQTEAALRAVLAPIIARLDRVEDRLANLPNPLTKS